jgi:hypothetical protein
LRKAWVTDNSQEDEAFFAMSQSSKTKKADWVKYVTAKIGSGGGATVLPAHAGARVVCMRRFGSSWFRLSACLGV